MRKYSVVSIHYTTKCNLNCPFCYKTRCNPKFEKPRQFWIDLAPYIKKISNQVALGGGEPFLDIKFIKDFSKACWENKLLLNVTTNGKPLQKLTDEELRDVLKDIAMVSISFDKEKVKSLKDVVKYAKLVQRIQTLTSTQVGCNLLIDKEMFRFKHSFINYVDNIFGLGVDRVFALYPKNVRSVDILKYIDDYVYLDRKYTHFYVDDLTKMILTERKHKNWKNACHYGKDIISINEKGQIFGCSFDSSKDNLLTISNPKDLLKIKNIKIKPRYSCPYLLL